MSMPDLRSAATSTSLRFLGLLKQPDGASVGQELELDERDVVWSSSTSSSSSPSPTPSPSAGGGAGGLRRPLSSRGFPEGSVGLYALLADDHASTAIPAAGRLEKQQPPQPYHQSAPVAVPAWPKGTDRDRRFREAEQEAEEDDDSEFVVPPHEMAARRAAAAASVMEGAGRTLKGRDLRRVRNAVWRTTGFLDL